MLDRDNSLRFNGLAGRIEYKYYVPLVVRPYLLDDLAKFTVADSHARDAEGGYRVASLYFENYRMKSYHDKLEGHAKRVKLRMRFYPPLESNGRVNIEFKYKIFDNIYKETAKIDRELFYRLCAADFNELDGVESDGVLAHFLKTKKINNFHPFIRIDYTRKALFASSDKNVRITIDSDVRCGRFLQDIDAEPEIMVLSPEIGVLEVKSPGYYPFWLSYIIKKYSLKRTDISKYSLSVQNMAINSSLTVR